MLHIPGRPEFKVTCCCGQNYCIMTGTLNLCCWTHLITGYLIDHWEWCHKWKRKWINTKIRVCLSNTLDKAKVKSWDGMWTVTHSIYHHWIFRYFCIVLLWKYFMMFWRIIVPSVSGSSSQRWQRRLILDCLLWSFETWQTIFSWQRTAFQEAWIISSTIVRTSNLASYISIIVLPSYCWKTQKTQNM